MMKCAWKIRNTKKGGLEIPPVEYSFLRLSGMWVQRGLLTWSFMSRVRLPGAMEAPCPLTFLTKQQV